MVATIPYRPRLVDSFLDELLTQLSAIMVVGPRTVGKTTTVARRAATTIRLDREVEAAAFAADPDVALRGLREPVLLDEWQNVPGVLGAVRRAVEADPRPGRFFVAGSVRAELEHGVWPATGRVVRMAMYPMSVRERLGAVEGPAFLDRLAAGETPALPDDCPDLRGYLDLALRSGFPDPALRLSGMARQAWLESYLDDLLTRDIEQVEEPRTRRRDVRRLRRYFEAYALNSAGLAPHKTIYDAAGINRETADAYEALLSSLLIVEELPAWTSNRLKRLTRQAKRYVIDPALVAAALKLDEDGALRDGGLLGRLLDTFVVAQLRPELAIAGTRPRLYHLRTQQGRHEVDLVAELAGQRVIGIEVTANAAPGKGDAAHLVWLRDELGPRFAAGVVLHTGPRTYPLEQGISALPIAALWG